MQWFTSLVFEFPEGRPLQRTLNREQLTTFFDVSKRRFDDPEFKLLLRMGVQRGSDAQELVNAMQKQVFEAMNVQGDFGIAFLGKVRSMYSNDAEMLRIFYEFVHREEMALDEAELPDKAFQVKYSHLSKVREQAEQHLAKMKGMDPVDQEAYMARVFQNMVMSSQAQSACQSRSCNHQHHGQAGGSNGAQPVDAAGIGTGVLASAEQLPFLQPGGMER